VFLDRYARKGADGQPVESTVEEMWDRVSAAIGRGSAERAEFRDLLDRFKFVPGGRILSGAGVDAEVTYYNCYVIPVETRLRRSKRGMRNDVVLLTFPDDATPDEVESMRADVRDLTGDDSGSDSREAIFDTIGLMVDIMSRGGGVGINWSVLRPKGTYLKRVNGTTSGPVSWMDVASRAVGVVEQGGSRRGAAMFMLDDWHPDLLEFIDAKRNYEAITNANVSIAISDEFMDAVREGGNWVFEFPETSDPQYNSRWDGDLAGWKAGGGLVVSHGSRPAREVWRAIVEAAWASGEPGVVFLGRYNAQSTGRGVERIISVNPCGEQGLGAYSVCNLGAMNLDAYVTAEDYEPPWFDWQRFKEDVGSAIRFLDRVVDENHYFIPENERIQKRLRRVGLGVMGLADALMGLGIKYGSDEAVNFVDTVFSDMRTAAVESSIDLARRYGPAPDWSEDMAGRPFLSGLDDPFLDDQIRKNGLRNIFLLTQAPTGTTSLLAGVNSGIEPLFDTEYIRTDRTGTHKVFSPAVSKYGSAYAVTANEVTVEQHIKMQAAVQRNIDSSVSKTINGPNSHTVEDVDKAYRLAYDSGLKGVAYFRDGSGRAQVLSREPEPAPEPDEYNFLRPASLAGVTVEAATRAGSAFITLNHDASGRPVELFVNVGRSGSDLSSMTEALGRLASLALRHGATVGGVANQLEGVGGNGNLNRAVPHAIGVALTALNAGTSPVIEGSSPVNRATYDICPSCHQASLKYEEGCEKCVSCDYSRC